MAESKNFMNLEQLSEVAFVMGREFDGIFYTNFFADCYNYAHNPQQYKQSFEKLKDNYRKTQKETQDPVKRAKLETLANFMDDIERAAATPYDKESQDFYNRFVTVAKVYYSKHNQQYQNFPSELRLHGQTGEQYSLMMLGKIDKFTNDKAKYDMLEFFVGPMVNADETESQKQALVMRANNPHATTRDLYYLMLMHERNGEHDNLQPIFQDIDTIARKELNAELSKDAPDLGKVNDIVNLVKYGADVLGDKQIQKQVEEVYNVNKMLMPDAAEYISKAPDVQSTKIADLEKQIADLKQQLAAKEQETQRINSEMNTLRQTLADAQDQNQTLNRENSALRQENTGLGQSKSNTDEKLQKLINAAKKMKGGLGSSGVNDYKKLVEELDSGR